VVLELLCAGADPTVENQVGYISRSVLPAAAAAAADAGPLPSQPQIKTADPCAGPHPCTMGTSNVAVAQISAQIAGGVPHIQPHACAFVSEPTSHTCGRRQLAGIMGSTDPSLMMQIPIVVMM
jgi:hypothetical protein